MFDKFRITINIILLVLAFFRGSQMTPMDKYQALAQLQDRNETLFFKAVIENIKEMAPIVYTPTGINISYYLTAID